MYQWKRQDIELFGEPNVNICIDAITSLMTSKLYIPIDTGLIIAEKYNRHDLCNGTTTGK